MLKKCTTTFIAAWIATSCGAAKNEAALSSGIDEESVIGSWFSSISEQMKSDPAFFSKVHETSGASFSGYAGFIQQRGKGVAFDAKATKVFQSLDKNYKSLAGLLKEQNVDTTALTRSEVKTALYVATHGEAPASISNLKGAAIAMKVAIFLGHQQAPATAGLALKGTSTSSRSSGSETSAASSSAAAPVVPTAQTAPIVPTTNAAPTAASSTAATSATPAAAGSSTASAATTTGTTAANTPAASIKTGTLADGASASASLMSGVAASVTASSTTEKNNADLKAQRDNAQNNRFCGTYTSGVNKDQNAYLPESQILANKDTKCPANTQRGSATSPTNNSAANVKDDIPNDPNNPSYVAPNDAANPG